MGRAGESSLRHECQQAHHGAEHRSFQGPCDAPKHELSVQPWRVCRDSFQQWRIKLGGFLPEQLPSSRAVVVAEVTADVLELPVGERRFVAVDSVDGAGKSVFAHELAEELTRKGAAVIRASVDGFHNPPEIRYRLGRASPEGFFRDSFDYGRLVSLLLEPLQPGGTGRYVQSVYDVHTETRAVAPVAHASPSSVLVLDGIFLHRDELVRFWDYSIWLEVPFHVSIPRGAQRGYGDPDPEAPTNRRYVEGQRLYISRCKPQERATVVIDNEQLDRPVLHRN